MKKTHTLLYAAFFSLKNIKENRCTPIGLSLFFCFSIFFWKKKEILCTFSFCTGRNAKKGLCTLIYSFFFVPPKKNESRKRRPPKTDLALLRLSMTARQIRFAQTPLVSVIGKLRIRSSTGRHARNGRCWQACNVDFA